MELIVVILLLIAIWVLYRIYVSYNDIVKELRQIRNKCIKDGGEQYISDSYTKEGFKQVKNGILSVLKSAMI